jgi:hypothetical protein
MQLCTQQARTDLLQVEARGGWQRDVANLERLVLHAAHNLYRVKIHTVNLFLKKKTQKDAERKQKDLNSKHRLQHS